jgi:hypothetical protein
MHYQAPIKDGVDLEITQDQFRSLMQGDLSEVCEFHSRGNIAEVISVAINDVEFCDGDAFDGVIVGVGPIDGSMFSNDGLHNLTCIGDGFTYLDGARFFAFNDAIYESPTAARDAAVQFAFDALVKMGMPVGV